MVVVFLTMIDKFNKNCTKNEFWKFLNCMFFVKMSKTTKTKSFVCRGLRNAFVESLLQTHQGLKVQNRPPNASTFPKLDIIDCLNIQYVYKYTHPPAHLPFLSIKSIIFKLAGNNNLSTSELGNYIRFTCLYFPHDEPSLYVYFGISFMH